MEEKKLLNEEINKLIKQKELLTKQKEEIETARFKCV